MDRIFSYIFSSNFLEGVLVTLELTFLSQAIAIVIGFVVALLKMSKFAEKSENAHLGILVDDEAFLKKHLNKMRYLVNTKFLQV